MAAVGRCFLTSRTRTEMLREEKRQKRLLEERIKSNETERPELFHKNKGNNHSQRKIPPTDT